MVLKSFCYLLTGQASWPTQQETELAEGVAARLLPGPRGSPSPGPFASLFSSENEHKASTAVPSS